MPTAAPAAEAIAETNGTAPPGATTAEGASGGREPGPSTPPQDVAGPSNPSPGDERGRAQPTEESQVPAVRAGEVAPAERAPLPGGHQEPVGGGGGPRSWLEELRGGAEGPAVEGGSDAALRDEADADAFRRQLLTTHSAMFPRGGAAAGRGAGGGAGEPEYARLQSLIEGALRQAEVQRETWAGEGSAAAARDSVLVGGIPRVQQEEGVAQALSQALFGRPNGGSDEPGQSTDGNPGAAPEQELEWLRAAAGDDPAVAGPSDDVMRGIYTKYVTYHRGLAEAQPAVQAEAEDGVGLHFRACGHAIHAKCLEGYFQSLHQSSMRR